ncbi:DUF4917 family protein [Amphritea balenae]|uniref:DUF4917 family protein n=1 Tax=Amphritea balenae TaxID=452629 RepID=A0A3P1SWV9_9GAMM|nr:DUF4917 family protein [Amphritea balenae]RRD01538.1 DUF4917 family protein [Amphritea balenae]GGK56124.1 DUF4917 domain-containing protein [Amphritea balenae]
MSNLLIGNGLSISISKKFSYTSLRERVSGGLSPAVERLFKQFDTDDFEHLLTKIKDARDVIEAITDGQVIVSQSISDEIKSKLIEAIGGMNPRGPRDDGLDPQALNSALKKYSNVFTTNYDIYLYWGRKGKDGFNINDFFFKGDFDLNRADPNNGDSIFFLHGALFVFDEGNKVVKIGKGEFITLDDAIKDRIVNKNSLPLFISEGSSQEKLSSIKKNEYLSFCYQNLRGMSGDLDIYGHGLSPDVDGHIVDAIKASKIDDITYYQYNLDQMNTGEVAHLQATLNTRLGRIIKLVDSSKHELSNWSIWGTS